LTPTRARSLTRRAAPPADPGGTDADLLGRFLAARDEAAFTALTSRHLPAVRAVCRSVLRDHNDADDAVQATFLVLVRRAETVRDRAALGAWLARVAWRAANNLREANARRAARTDATDLDRVPAAPPADRSAADALNEEIARLPERYRVAVLTCYAAGTPVADAAAQLGWPKGTLLTRLAWARRRLRQRLEARGLAPAAFAAVFAPRAARIGAAMLADRIGRSAVLYGTNDPLAKVVISARVFTLTEGLVRAMIATKLKVAAVVVLAAVALLGLGLGRMTADGQPGRKAAAPAPAPAAPPADRAAPPADRAAPPARADAEPGRGDDLVVRRPHGSYTKEVPQYGKATLTFTETRLHVRAAVRIDKATFTVEADADYSINRESVVYGVLTSVELGGLGGEEAEEVELFAAAFVDMPFSFRVRVEDDGVSIKDIRCGPFGSLLFSEMLGSGDAGKEAILVTTMVGGKYRTDPNPVRPAPPAAAPAPVRARPRAGRADAGPGFVPQTLPPGPAGAPAQPGQLSPYPH
jgi:RNA polymerase sigma factor (sigma-70 family)